MLVFVELQQQGGAAQQAEQLLHLVERARGRRQCHELGERVALAGAQLVAMWPDRLVGRLALEWCRHTLHLALHLLPNRLLRQLLKVRRHVVLEAKRPPITDCSREQHDFGDCASKQA